MAEMTTRTIDLPASCAGRLRWAHRMVSGLVLAGGVCCAWSCAGDARARAEDGAQVIDETMVGPRMLDLTISSPALAMNAQVRLLLPRDFAAQPATRWPVLYLLHGARAVPDGDPPNYHSWTYHTDIEAFTADSNVLVVMPEGGNFGWYSDWYNGGNGGPPAWETFHLVELTQILEAQYRAGTARAIAGLSMGGFGAASYAGRHPGMFRAVASYSGALQTIKYAAIPRFTLSLNGFDPDALWGNNDPSSPDNRLDIWRDHDPYELVPAMVDIPVFVASGDGNAGPLDPPSTATDAIEQGALDSSQGFVEGLQAMGGTAMVDFYGPGKHTWPYWEQELHRSFGFLKHAIGAD